MFKIYLNGFTSEWRIMTQSRFLKLKDCVRGRRVATAVNGSGFTDSWLYLTEIASGVLKITVFYYVENFTKGKILLWMVTIETRNMQRSMDTWPEMNHKQVSLQYWEIVFSKYHEICFMNRPSITLCFLKLNVLHVTRAVPAFANSLVLPKFCAHAFGQLPLFV